MGTTYDAVIIGAGQAGPALAVRLAGTGKKVAIVERNQFGGTCVNTGCIPTKTLIASARVAHMARRAMEYGVEIGTSITVDMKRVKERKDGVVRSSNEGLEKWLRGTENLTVYKGHARFEGPRQLRIADQLIEADQIFINVGARANVPPLPRPRSGELSHQLEHDGRRLSARASDCRWRQLCGFGVWSNVSPLRQ
jgi:pyruvate/2-oxoglutarate dehydrogenase complex dihydrolipoamide dehydrogenase (E3) component